MSDPTAIAPPTGYVTFKRMVQISPFNTATAEIMLQIPTSDQWFTTDPDGNRVIDVDRIIGDAKPAFFAAKAVVYEQLGVPFEVDGSIVVREILHKELGAVEITEAESKAIGETVTVAAQATTTAPKAGAPSDTSKDGLWADLCANPKGWYDNRTNKRNPKGPDFKNKANGDLALWLEFKGQSQVPSHLTVPDASAF